MKTIKKDECSYSVSNAIRTLAMVRPKGFEPPAPGVGELRQGGVNRRGNVNFVGSAHLPPKQEKAHCWLSQQAFSAF